MAHGGFHQESPAPPSLANVQQQGSATHVENKKNLRANKLAKTYKFKRYKQYTDRKRIASKSKSTQNNTTIAESHAPTTTQN